MSDRYLLNDANTHYSCCQNSYKIARADSNERPEDMPTLAELRAQQDRRKSLIQRLLHRRRTPATTS